MLNFSYSGAVSTVVVSEPPHFWNLPEEEILDHRTSDSPYGGTKLWYKFNI